MEKLTLALASAQKHIRTADHLLTQTYPLVKDTKLLIAVLDNILIAAEEGMNVVLYHERKQKKIKPFHNNFESKFDIFQQKIASLNNLQDFVQTIYESKILSDMHKKSAVEFARKDALVMATDDYHLQSVSFERLVKMTDIIKRFIEKVEKITRQVSSILEESEKSKEKKNSHV